MSDVTVQKWKDPTRDVTEFNVRFVVDETTLQMMDSKMRREYFIHLINEVIEQFRDELIDRGTIPPSREWE